MTRLSLFNSPFLLGFDELERALDRSAKASSDGYPPYNIEQIDEDGLRITLAVAGFSQHDLSVTVEDRQLIIRGKQSEDDDRVYLHRGIAARQFQRQFVLAEGIEVVGADLDDGIARREVGGVGDALQDGWVGEEMLTERSSSRKACLTQLAWPRGAAATARRNGRTAALSAAKGGRALGL